jgi:membrane protease YdiL (CAAX protease family)
MRPFRRVVTAQGEVFCAWGASMVGPMSDRDPGAAPPGGGPPPLSPGYVPQGYVPREQVGAAGVARPAPPPPPVIDQEDGPFLDRPGVPPTTKSHAWHWLLYAVGGFLVGQLMAAVFGLVAGALAGKTSAEMKVIASANVPPEWYVISTLLGLWIGFVGGPWLASRRHGTRHFLADLGVRFRLIDLVGIVVGVVGQIVISIIYAPFRHDIHNFNAPSQKLTGASHGGGFVVIALATIFVAPFLEELLFRGLLLKALVRLCTPVIATPSRARSVGVVLAIIADGVLFGLAHGEFVQLAGLALFGIALAAISYRTGRQGMNMVAHASFNFVAIASILGWIH